MACPYQAVLKRILKVQPPMLQLHVLKLIKSQVPFCGRKWRQCELRCISGRLVLLSFDVARCAHVANMQVITAIYLNCRPDLRDEWLTGIEVDDVYDAQVSRGRSLAESAHLPYLICRLKSRHYAIW